MCVCWISPICRWTAENGGGIWRSSRRIRRCAGTLVCHCAAGRCCSRGLSVNMGQTGAATPVCGEVTLRFRFYVDEVPKGVRLAVETPERFVIRLNGSALPAVETDAFWVDACFKRIPVPDTLLRAGENELTLQAAFTPDLNLEAAYLLGDFGVRLSGLEKHLTALPSVLRAGDTVPQGLPFYGAGIGYRAYPAAAGAGKPAGAALPGMPARRCVRGDHRRPGYPHGGVCALCSGTSPRWRDARCSCGIS